jgi:hypothetical protein
VSHRKGIHPASPAGTNEWRGEKATLAREWATQVVGLSSRDGLSGQGSRGREASGEVRRPPLRSPGMAPWRLPDLPFCIIPSLGLIHLLKLTATWIRSCSPSSCSAWSWWPKLPVCRSGIPFYGLIHALANKNLANRSCFCCLPFSFAWLPIHFNSPAR